MSHGFGSTKHPDSCIFRNFTATEDCCGEFMLKVLCYFGSRASLTAKRFKVDRPPNTLKTPNAGVEPRITRITSMISRIKEMKVGATSGAHSIAPHLPYERECVLSSSDSQRLQRGRVHRPRNAQIPIFLITGKSGFCLVANSSVDCAVIIPKLRKLRLNRAHGCSARGLT
jgi:hypothetical protein